MRTDDLLAELAALETPSPKPAKTLRAEAPKVEAESIKPAEPDTELGLDERGYKVLALTDLVIQEFDRAITALSTVKDAVKALREELSAPSEPELVEGEQLTPEQAEAVDDGYSAPVERNLQGESNAMGDISISI